MKRPVVRKKITDLRQADVLISPAGNRWLILRVMTSEKGPRPLLRLLAERDSAVFLYDMNDRPRENNFMVEQYDDAA